MDGLKKRINNSIQTRLLVVMMATIVIAAILALFATFLIAKNEALELQDATLDQVIALTTQGAGNAQEYAQHNKESGLIITSIYPATNQIWQSKLQPSVLFDQEPRDGLITIKIGDTPYRAIIRTINSSQKLVVAQPTKLRDDAAISSAVTSLTILLLLAVLTFMLIYWAIRASLQSLTDLSQQITQGKFDDLSALNEENLPIEVRPFILEINRLFNRISQAIDIQRRFIADAAHELRTPLAALSLQVESLSDVTKSSDHVKQVYAIQLGVERCTYLVNQMLTLAKVQSSIELQADIIDLKSAIVEVVEEFMPMVETKHIDLGIKISEQIKLECRSADFKTIIRNVLGNAVKYTQINGIIEISAIEEPHQIQINIEDNGPGLAPTEMTKVFEPFYQGSNTEKGGVGLGLSIAKSAMERIGGVIHLSKSQSFESGLMVTLSIHK
jgi:two-component system OmpR family sensor kinase